MHKMLIVQNLLPLFPEAGFFIEIPILSTNF